MNNLKLTSKVLCKISLIINKMGISSLIADINSETGDDKLDREAIVKKLLALVVDNLYKAEDEIISLVSELKGITIEEAGQIDLIPIIKELLSEEKIRNFLKLA